MIELMALALLVVQEEPFNVFGGRTFLSARHTPAAVRSAARRAHPGIRWQAAVRWKEAGGTRYKLQGWSLPCKSASHGRVG